MEESISADDSRYTLAEWASHADGDVKRAKANTRLTDVDIERARYRGQGNTATTHASYPAKVETSEVFTETSGFFALLSAINTAHAQTREQMVGLARRKGDARF